jgi:hypothetical protein
MPYKFKKSLFHVYSKFLRQNENSKSVKQNNYSKEIMNVFNDFDSSSLESSISSSFSSATKYTPGINETNIKAITSTSSSGYGTSIDSPAFVDTYLYEEHNVIIV